MNGWQSTKTVYMSPFTKPMTKPLIFGIQISACLQSASFVLVTIKARLTLLITFGRWAIRVLVALVPKSSMITALTSKVASQAHLKKTATALSRFGTVYLCSSIAKKTALCCHYLRQVSIRAWGLSASVPSCKVSTATIKSTCLSA